MKMLIALDFSPIGREAAEGGYRYGRQLGADVTFLHIVPAIASPLEGYNMHFYITPEARSTEEKVRAAAAEKVNLLVEEIKKEYGEMPAGQKCDIRVNVADNPGSEIVRVADSERYDTIVIGNKGYTTLERVILGSTALKVVNQAKCSVWLYRHPR